MLGFPCNISATAEASNFNLPRSWALSRTIIKAWGAWPWTRGIPQNLEIPFNIYTMAKASNFKFGTQLGFAKAHYKITPIGKVGVVLG